MSSDRRSHPRERYIEPRKTPRQSRAGETVRFVLEAVALIIEEEGREGFNTNAVARRAGVSIGSLYQYFPNKDALVVALIRDHTRTFLADLDAAIERSRSFSFAETAEELLHVAVRQQLSRPGLARFLDVEERRLPIDDEVLDTNRAIRERIEKVIEEQGPATIADRRQVAARDLMNIARAIIDDVDPSESPSSLKKRVSAAIRGYLMQFDDGGKQ